MRNFPGPFWSPQMLKYKDKNQLLTKYSEYSYVTYLCRADEQEIWHWV